MSDIPTIAEAARLIASRKLSPVELTHTLLVRIRRFDPALNSFLLVTEERAMSDARAAEDRVMRGETKGQLDAIPIGYKDIYNTAGIRTTAHSRLLEDNIPTEDATTVRALADAGTVMMGKLATHEFAIGGPATDLPWPSPKNPWNTAHAASGSSSGTAVAVAAGLILGGTGSDTGGSIRAPAAICGIAGIKPTYGLVSRTGVIPLSFSLDHAGPMAWTVEDCALLLQAMAGSDPADPGSVRNVVTNYTDALNEGVEGLRIGIVRHFHEVDHRASASTIAGIDDAVDVFTQLGAVVTEIQLSPLIEYHSCGFLIMLAEAYAVHEPWLTERFYDYGDLTRTRISLGGYVRSADYIQALRRRRELGDEMAKVMADFDVIITAAQAGEAVLSSDVPKWGIFDATSFTIPFNVTGYPAMSICTGFGPGGLPLAMQIAAMPFREATIFRVANAYENATNWRSRRPAVT